MKVNDIEYREYSNEDVYRFVNFMRYLIFGFIFFFIASGMNFTLFLLKFFTVEELQILNIFPYIIALVFAYLFMRCFKNGPT